MPGFIKPQLATPKSRAPKGDQWLHEIKFDGYRIQVHVNGGRKKVYTRNGLDWTNRFSVIAGALDFSGQAIIDGEVASMKGAPTSRNCRLNLPPVDRIDLSTSPSISFGVMETSGSSHRSSASRHTLLDLLSGNGIGSPVVYSEHLVGDGQEMFWHSAKPRQAGGQGAGLHGEGRDGMVPHGIQRNSQAT